MSEQQGFAFPQSLTEKYRPRTIDSFMALETELMCNV